MRHVLGFQKSKVLRIYCFGEVMRIHAHLLKRLCVLKNASIFKGTREFHHCEVRSQLCHLIAIVDKLQVLLEPQCFRS